jgi:hypothetical protein
VKGLLLVLFALLLVTAGGANGGRAPSLTLSAKVAAPGDELLARIVGAGARTTFRLYLLRDAALPGGAATRVGTVVSDRRGNAGLRFRVPMLGPDVYYLLARGQFARSSLRSRVLSLRALPPPGFGALGSAGCAPASPRNTTGTGFAQTEVFGTASGAQLWALAATDASGEVAVLNGVIGKEKKIIFRMTSGVPTNFYAVAPDGVRAMPIWGPTPHGSSDWNRPGHEWGAGFVFGQTGCWRIHAGSGPVQGDVWLDIAS